MLVSAQLDHNNGTKMDPLSFRPMMVNNMVQGAKIFVPFFRGVEVRFLIWSHKIGVPTISVGSDSYVFGEHR